MLVGGLTRRRNPNYSCTDEAYWLDLLAQCFICHACLICKEFVVGRGEEYCSEEFCRSRHPCRLSNNSWGENKNGKLLISCQSHHRQVRLFFFSPELAVTPCSVMSDFFYFPPFHGLIRFGSLVLSPQFSPVVLSFLLFLYFKMKEIKHRSRSGVHFSWRLSNGLGAPSCICTRRSAILNFPPTLSTRL